MTDHKVGTRAEWLAAQVESLEAEKELTRRSDDLVRRLRASDLRRSGQRRRGQIPRSRVTVHG
jgi:predicted dithiol-disulfide oxidoreductase (DUF899 family)